MWKRCRKVNGHKSQQSAINVIHKNENVYCFVSKLRGRCTNHEIEAAIFQAGNTSPGPDEISPSILKKAWLVYKDKITCLFQICLEKGYHPKIFKNPTLYILLKSEIYDYLFFWFYWLIIILFYLGKALKYIYNSKALGIYCFALNINVIEFFIS